ncbi:Pentatricopeptide repeat-containing protein At4g21705, mitochondrial [Linum perenne]
MNSKLVFRALTQAQNWFISRSYNVSKGNTSTLYSKISPLGNPGNSVSVELDKWIQAGRKVHFPELQRIIQDLRKRRRFSQALEVSEWMSKSGTVTFSPVEHAIRIDLIGKVNGSESAENYFNSLRDIDKTHKTYGALLNCYVRQKQMDKSISHMQKMKELGFASSPITYNDIMCLYTNIGQHEKVPSVLAEMKASNVSPDNYSYRICITSYGVRSEIEEMEKILHEMEQQDNIVMDWNTYTIVANFYIKAGLRDKAMDALRKAEEVLEWKDGTGFSHLISLNAALGNVDEVLRLWDMEKSRCKRCINKDYIVVLESLVKLKEIGEAEKVLKEWRSSGNCQDFSVPNVVVIGCVQQGLLEKAEALIRESMKKGMAVTPNILATVAKGFLDKGEMAKACELMHASLSRYVENKGWRPNPKVITDILHWLGDEGSIGEAKAFVNTLKTVIPVNRAMYHALLKACKRNGAEVETILQAMEADGINQNQRTQRIIGKKLD